MLCHLYIIFTLFSAVYDGGWAAAPMGREEGGDSRATVIISGNDKNRINTCNSAAEVYHERRLQHYHLPKKLTRLATPIRPVSKVRLLFVLHPR